MDAFSLIAHHDSLQLTQQRAVWSLPPQGGSEGPTILHLPYSTAISYPATSGNLPRSWHTGFFQELKLHLQFPGFPFELAQPRALIHGQRRFLAGVLTAVNAHPVTECAFVDSELLCNSGDRARRLDHHLHCFV